MSGAIIVKEAMIECREFLIDQHIFNTDAFMICQVHDQIDFEVREDLAEEVTKQLEGIMIEVGNRYVTKVNMEVESTITDQWVK